MIDVPRALKIAVDTGKVRFGTRQVRLTAKAGKARLVVVASNCPDDLAALGAKVLTFQGTNAELGAACGKPFSVSALAVVDPGDSNILSA
jgi:large subunit ribosomal protein L30e